MKWFSLAAPLLLTAISTAAPAHSPQNSQRPLLSSAVSQPTAALDPLSGLRWIPLSALPVEGQQTYRLIVQGGPFPYARDRVVFQNREGSLPPRHRGTYHEYTVKTPGSRDRGGRRIVCATPPANLASECYSTADHYASFQRIRP